MKNFFVIVLLFIASFANTSCVVSRSTTNSKGDTHDGIIKGNHHAKKHKKNHSLNWYQRRYRRIQLDRSSRNFQVPTND